MARGMLRRELKAGAIQLAVPQELQREVHHQVLQEVQRMDPARTASSAEIPLDVQQRLNRR
jgi:hypothetical protein